MNADIKKFEQIMNLFKIEVLFHDIRLEIFLGSLMKVETYLRKELQFILQGFLGVPEIFLGLLHPLFDQTNISHRGHVLWQTPL